VFKEDKVQHTRNVVRNRVGWCGMEGGVTAECGQRLVVVLLGERDGWQVVWTEASTKTGEKGMIKGHAWRPQAMNKGREIRRGDLTQ